MPNHHDDEDVSATGDSRRRLPYAKLPDEVRSSIEGWLGAEIVAVFPSSHGFSPGMVARVDLADGRRVFIKSVGAEINEESAAMYRAEIEACRSLPAAPTIPQLLWSHDSGGWVTMIFEFVDGHPPALPWNSGDLERVISAVEDLAAAMTPPPVTVPDIVDVYGPRFIGWRRLLEAADSFRDRLDPWAAERLPRLAAVEEGWSEAAERQTLLHGDLRSDNVLLSEDRVVMVDWPWACIGPRWFDLVAMLPSVRLEGGPEPWEIFDRSRLAPAGGDAVTAILAAITGFFVYQSLLPPPPGIPAALREFQARQGAVALGWLKRRM